MEGLTIIRHACGTLVQGGEIPQLYDVTSLSDVPPHMAGIPFDRLPREYHTWIQIGAILYWFDLQGSPITHCPGCQAQLPRSRRGREGEE